MRPLLNLKWLHCYPRLCNRYTRRTLSNKTDAGFLDTVEYPPIEEVPIDQLWLQKKTDWIKKVQNLPTVEQKLIELNMPKYYGYWSCCLNDQRPKITCSDYLKYITRTHVIEGFPENYYSDIETEVEPLVKLLKTKVEDVILLHAEGLTNTYHPHDNRARSAKYNTTESFIQSLNFVLMRVLAEYIPHLSAVSTDIKPRIEGFWFVGGYEMREQTKKIIKNKPELNGRIAELIDIPVRSTVHPTLAIRTKHCLPCVVAMDDDLATSADIPVAASHPGAYGLGFTRKAACIVPGFWPGVKDEHSQLFIHPRFDVVARYGYESIPLIMEFQSLLCGFTQAQSYALYQGFTPLNELTYPIVQQTVTTDGQNWCFHLYQMNTCALHSEFISDNPRNNILWMSKDMPLFESVEGESVKGLNEEVLKNLVLMYLKKGQPQENPHPYLADYKYVKNHDAPKEYKKYFHEMLLGVLNEYRTGQRKPYIAMWEKIYKVWFPSRFQDKKYKFFEFMHSKIKGPEARRLDYYELPYIPRVNRRNPYIKYHPRLDSEELFKHDYRTIRKAKLVPDDKIAFRSFNILPNSERYRSGKSTRKWTRFKTINIVGDEDDL